MCVFQPLGASDYLEIARHFDTVIIRNVPRLKVALKDQARRLVTLIDIFYDQKVKEETAALCRTAEFREVQSVALLAIISSSSRDF